MKYTNKVLAIILSGIMIFAAGCQKKESASLLPFGLEFGAVYEEIQKANDIGDLKDSQSNAGYVTNLKYISKEEEIIEIIGTSDGVSDVAIMLAFNAEKKLYEFYCIFTLENDKVAEINDVIKQKYNKVAGEEEEESNGIALWKNEKYVIDYRCTEPYGAVLGEDVQYVIAIHSNELDFE